MLILDVFWGEVQSDSFGLKTIISLSVIGSLILLYIVYKLWKKYGSPGKTISREMERKRFLLEYGKAGTAKIVSIKRTGLSINDQPEVRFHLNLQLADGNLVELETKRIVDVLEIPRIQPGSTVSVVYNPRDPTDFEMVFEEKSELLSVSELLAQKEGSGEEPGEVSGSGAPFDYPLWMFGLRDAETWVFPPRGRDRLRLLVIDFSDPHDDEGSDEREWIVDSAAFLIAETFWISTDMPASAAVMINTEKKKLIQSVGRLAEYEDLKPFIDVLDYKPVIVWGAAGRDLKSDGVTVKIRLGGEESERTLTAPLPEMVEMLRSWLIGRDVCKSVDQPDWYKKPDDTLLPLYAVLMHNLQLQVLADKKNRALEPLDPGMHHDYVDYAMDLAKDFSDKAPQLKIIALTTALYAKRAECLTDEGLKSAEELLDSTVDPDHPLFRLSPLFLNVFGKAQEAGRRYKSLISSAQGSYAEWLKKLEIAEKG